MPSATIVLVLCYILCRTDLDRHRIAGRESAWADIGPAVDQAPLGGGPMWELFGDSDYQFRVVSAVRAPSGGGLEVFGLAEDGSVWQNLSTTPSIDDWTGWSLFGRRPGSGRVFRGRGNPGLVSLGVNASWDGRLRVSGAASDGGAWLNAQTWAMDGWGGWLRFGVISNWRRRISILPDGWARFGDSAGLREVVVPSTGVSLMNVVFGLSVDDAVWINILDQVGHSERWRGWQEFGDGSLRLSALAIGRPDDLTIEAIGIRSDDNTVWRNSAHVYDLDQWSGWQPFGAPGDQFHAVASLRTGGPDGSESDVFGLALDDTVWRRAPGGNAWARFGDPADLLSTITPIWNNGGIAVALAGTGPDYSTWHADLLPSGQWGPLQPFGSPSVGLRQLDFALDIDLRTHAFAIDPNGAVWHKSQTTPGTWPPP
jgi:hypothetical protein